MTEQYAVAALVRKRAEITGRIKAVQAELGQLCIDLDNVDATLRLFDPSIELEEIKPSAALPWHQAYRGEIFRIVLDTLRDAREPVTAYEIAMNVMAKKKLNTADKRLIDKFEKRVGSVLRYHRQRGKVKSAQGVGQRMVWGLTSP